MSFWKKIFGRKGDQGKSSKATSHFDKYRAELDKLGLKDMEDFYLAKGVQDDLSFLISHYNWKLVPVAFALHFPI